MESGNLKSKTASYCTSKRGVYSGIKENRIPGQTSCGQTKASRRNEGKTRLFKEKGGKSGRLLGTKSLWGRNGGSKCSSFSLAEMLSCGASAEGVESPPRAKSGGLHKVKFISSPWVCNGLGMTERESSPCRNLPTPSQQGFQ